MTARLENSTRLLEAASYESWVSVLPAAPPDLPLVPLTVSESIEDMCRAEISCLTQSSVIRIAQCLAEFLGLSKSFYTDSRQQVLPLASVPFNLINWRRHSLWRAWFSSPAVVLLALVDLQLIPVKEDGELLLAILGSPTSRKMILDKILSHITAPATLQEKSQVATSLVDILFAALNLSELDASGSTMPLAARAAATLQDRSFFQENWEARAPEFPRVVKCWKHFRTRSFEMLDSISQLQVEKELRLKWLDRLLGHLIPFASSIPNMKRVMDSKNPIQEFRDLFGDSRWRSLRTYCLKLEAMLKHGLFSIPWTEPMIRGLLNSCRTEEMTPSQVEGFWNVLKALNKRLGVLDINSISVLMAKKDAITDVLVPKVSKPLKQAHAPGITFPGPLEQAIDSQRDASGSLLPPGLHYYIVMARWLLGSSGRFNDAQHTNPYEMLFTSSAIEAHPWQTKVVKRKDAKKRPVVLICPTQSFQPGSTWWRSCEAWVQVFKQSKQASEMDFIFPELTSDFRGFIFRPVSYDRGLRVLKHALSLIGVSPELIQLISWHSLRVLVPELAYQALVPASLRSFLGNWAKESTADVYTREKRAVVAKIHDSVLRKASDLMGIKPRSVRVDLEHQDWSDESMQSNAVALGIIQEPSPKKPRLTAESSDVLD